MATDPDTESRNVWIQSVPVLLSAACVGLAGLFVQVAKIDSLMTTVVQDIQELKNDSKETLNDLERRVRILELRK